MNLMHGMLGLPLLWGALVGALLTSAGAFLFMRRARETSRQSQRLLQTENRRNHAVVEGSGEGVLELDHVGNVRYANPAAGKLLGYEADELVGLDYRILINDQVDGDAVRRVRYTTDIMRGVGALLRRKDGQYRPVQYKIVPVTEQGVTIGTVLVFRDITERVRLDNLLKDMQATAKIGGWEYDLDAKTVHWTEALYAMHELAPNTPLGDRDLLAMLHPEDQIKMKAAVQKAIDSGSSADFQARLTNARGRHLHVRIILQTERREGRTVRLHGTMQDITDLVMAERQLRETRDFFELTLNAVPTPVIFVDTKMLVTYANRAMEEWLERTHDQIVGQHLREILTSESLISLGPQIAAAMRGESVLATQSGIRNGRAREWQTHLVPQIGPNREVMGFFSILYDLTEIKRLESRLLQAQKMEAIGQLTGGIAHDFNNLLGVVIGNLQLIERSVSETPGLARKVHTAMRAATRGADLTKRLLAFARRQILDPTVVDLNRQLAGLQDLMQRSLGDSVEVRMVQSHDLWHTRVDAGQFENAILNLAINARDAMAQGGRLTVRTQNVVLDSAFCADHPQIEPGEYVSVSVTDTGCGIEPDILKRVFEPFFTTKESGKGSGLGLAMVHGFAEQSGGIATIESKVGRGTTVQILLPRSREAQAEREDTIVSKVAPGGSETILVVEDDADLRETVVTALSLLGYRALSAPNAAAALRILAGSEKIELLFTDVMMPGGMLGPALAKRARELRPNIEVLFTTGFAETNVLATTAGLSSTEVINKPYRNEDLAMRIRYVLDREARVA
jgi:PAS domain S-box-containing protein